MISLHRFNHLYIVLLTCLLWVMAGCTAAPTAPTTTPLPATMTPTVTATIDWFPATATPTPQPPQTLEPTLDPRPPLGALLLEEDYAAANWITGQTSAGTIAVDANGLTLAVSATAGRIFTLRQATSLSDFYLETVVDISLCRGDDAYGIIFRASSDQAFYRLWLTCRGAFRLERIRGAEVGVLQDWTPATSVPIGAPVSLPLAIVADGQDLQIYANGVFQFAIRDPLYKEGSIGFAARAAGDSPVTITFTKLKVYELRK